jgi:hypothetical protein
MVAEECWLLYGPVCISRYLAMNGKVIHESPVEAGSNTSTVALRIVGGDENGIQCRGGIIGPPCVWGI